MFKLLSTKDGWNGNCSEKPTQESIEKAIDAACFLINLSHEYEVEVGPDASNGSYVYAVYPLGVDVNNRQVSLYYSNRREDVFLLIMRNHASYGYRGIIVEDNFDASTIESHRLYVREKDLKEVLKAFLLC